MAEQRGNIAEFNSPVDSLRPTDEGAHAYSEAGYMEGKLYRQAGEDYKQAAGVVGGIIEQHETMSEISQGSAALAAMHNNMSQQWNKTATTSDPNDTTIQKDFLDNTVEPQLQQWQSSFVTEAGQKWAMGQADSMRTHYYETTAADMSARAGNARVQNAVTQLNQLSSAAYNDPRSADLSFKQVDAVYDAAKENSDGLLSVEQVNKINDLKDDAHNEIVKNAIKGYADSEDPRGPAMAKKLLDSGQFDSILDGDEQKTLYGYIDNQNQSRQVAAAQKQQAAVTQQEVSYQQEGKSIFSTMASGQPYLATAAFANQKLTTQMRNDLVAQKTGILSLPQGFLTSASYGDKFSDAAQLVYSGQPITAQSLFAGVRRQEITPAGAVQLQALADKAKTPEGLAEINAQGAALQQMKSQIVKGGPGTYDPQGQKIYNNMLNSFYPAWDAAIRAGKTPAQLADPQSKDYIGNVANGFKRSDAQALADVTKGSAPAATQQQAKVSIPALADRKVGQSYPTPKGNMTWTDKGWIPSIAKPTVPRPE